MKIEKEVKINGRYPQQGTAFNTVSILTLKVISTHGGRIIIDGGEQILRVEAEITIPPNAHYFVQTYGGKTVFLQTADPPLTPDQHHLDDSS